MTVYSNTALQHCIQQDYRCECAAQCTGRNKQNRTWMIIPSRAPAVLTATLKGWNLRAVRYIKPIDEIEIQHSRDPTREPTFAEAATAAKAATATAAKQRIRFPSHGDNTAPSTHFIATAERSGDSRHAPPPLFLYKLKVTSPRAPGRTPKPSRPA